MPKDHVFGPGTPITRYRDGRKSHPAAIGMLLEGDSWFSFPAWLRTNITMGLKTVFGERIVQLNLSNSGDEAREMLCGPSFAELHHVLAEQELHFDCILFSGGGNDLVSTNLPVLLRPFKEGMTWEDCLRLDRFDRRLQEIEFAYRDLADLRDDYQPEAIIFTHSYDYAVPSGKSVKLLGVDAAGGWIKAVMDARAIPPALQRELLHQILARFDDMLLRLAQTQPRWRHVRTQGTLADNEWGDELHPNAAGFKKIVAKFEAALVEAFPKLGKA